ncbi:MAG: GNAT family N-acetyltransferase [Brumimicrobium sp.]
MRIALNDDVDKNKWEEFLNRNSLASPFQTPAFYQFINSLENHKAEVIAVSDDQNKMKALAVVTIHNERGIKKYFSKRGVIYGGPLFTDQSSSKYLVNLLAQHFRKQLIYLEVRNFFDYSEFHSSYIKWEHNQHLNVQVETTNFEDIDDYLKSLKYNRRREIKQSIKNGATYSQCRTKQEVREVYEILRELYEKRVKLPLPPFNFFGEMLNNESFVVFKVIHDDKIIGGAFCPVLRGRGIYTMYYCGIRNYHKKIFPTHLAVLATIDFSFKNHLKKVDLMGAGRPDETYGVRKYKEQFGGKTVQHGRYLLILKPLLFKFGKVGLSVLRKLK